MDDSRIFKKYHDCKCIGSQSLRQMEERVSKKDGQFFILYPKLRNITKVEKKKTDKKNLIAKIKQ